MPSKPNLWFVVASAVLVALAFPPINLALLVFVALVPWLVFLHSCDAKQAIKSGFVFGLIFWLTQLQWMIPFVNRWTHSAWLGFVPWLLMPVLMIWYFPALAWILHRAIQVQAWWAIPCAWGLIEWFRSTVPGVMFSWGLLAHPLAKFPILIQAAAFGQEFLVSSWVVLVNVLVWMIFQQVHRRHVLQTMVASLVMAMLSAARYASPPPATNQTVTLIQTGYDLAFSDPEIARAKTRQSALAGIDYAIRSKADWAVLPEDVEIRDSDQPRVPVVFGALRKVNGTTLRSAVAKLGTEQQFADKTRLVLFGEYVPFRDQLPFLNNFGLPSGDITSGDRPSVLTVAGKKVGPLICFEALFSDVAFEMTARQGAQVLAVLSIDDWYQGSGAIEQLSMASIWRSVEAGVPTVRAGSLGVTQACDARGNLLVRAEYGKSRALNQVLPVPATADGFEYRNWIWLPLLLGTATAFRRTKTNESTRAN